MKSEAIPQPEFSRRVQVHRGVEPLQSFRIEASEAERAALAKRFGLIALESFRSEGSVTMLEEGRRAVLRGSLDAKVVQSCVVTLEPVPAKVHDDFEVEYAADATAPAEEELEFDPEAPDPPDPLIGEAIDVGEAAAEHLALALEPYPRVPGAALPNASVDEEEPELTDFPAKNSPFAALARLRGKGQK